MRFVRAVPSQGMDTPMGSGRRLHRSTNSAALAASGPIRPPRFLPVGDGSGHRVGRVGKSDQNIVDPGLRVVFEESIPTDLFRSPGGNCSVVRRPALCPLRASMPARPRIWEEMLESRRAPPGLGQRPSGHSRSGRPRSWLRRRRITWRSVSSAPIVRLEYFPDDDHVDNKCGLSRGISKMRGPSDIPGPRSSSASCSSDYAPSLQVSGIGPVNRPRITGINPSQQVHSVLDEPGRGSPGLPRPGPK